MVRRAITESSAINPFSNIRFFASDKIARLPSGFPYKRRGQIYAIVTYEGENISALRGMKGVSGQSIFISFSAQLFGNYRLALLTL